MKHEEMECDPQLWIPPELVRNILKRLPVRTLNRLQYLCKDWKNLINDPSFIQEHLRCSAPENPSLLFHAHTVLNPLELYTIDGEMQVLPVNSMPLIEFLRGAMVVGSINGLLCIKSTYEYLNVLLWNPAISQFKLLIRERKFWVKTGFGFCSVVNDYVIISYFAIASLIDKVEVYSLSTGSWKEVAFGKLLEGVEIKSDGFCTNGAIFWFGFQKWNDHLFVSYHIATEEFAFIPLPMLDSESPDVICNRLSVYENKLALLSDITIGNSGCSLIDLWVMEEYKGNKSEEGWIWTWKYSFEHPYLLVPGVVWRNMIVCNGVDLFTKQRTASLHNVIDDGLNTVLVNITTNELKKFSFPRYGIGFCVFNYVESLVTVD